MGWKFFKGVSNRTNQSIVSIFSNALYSVYSLKILFFSFFWHFEKIKDFYLSWIEKMLWLIFYLFVVCVSTNFYAPRQRPRGAPRKSRVQQNLPDFSSKYCFNAKKEIRKMTVYFASRISGYMVLSEFVVDIQSRVFIYGNSARSSSLGKSFREK